METIRSNLKYHIMKKLFRHFLSAILFAVPCMYASAAWDGTSAAEYAGGNGTKDNPYLIATESQFAKFANDVSTIPDSAEVAISNLPPIWSCTKVSVAICRVP